MLSEKKNRIKFKNYVEIFINSKLDLIKKQKKKKTYQQKKFVWGVDLNPELPKNPDIVIKNNFSKNISNLSSKLINKLKIDYLNE